MASLRLPAILGVTISGLLAAGAARAEAPVQRTFFQLASSNGHGAVLLDLSQARLTHFREHLFASEEQLFDQNGNEIWDSGQPKAVITRDLLYDAYFGLRVLGDQKWLTGVPVDLDASGYAAWSAGKTAGTGVATMVQQSGAIQATQFFFAPRGLVHDAFVMAMRLKNTGASAVTGVSAFTIHNFHLGYGRPATISDLKSSNIGDNGETISFDAAKNDFLERGFAGVVVGRALAPVAHHGASWSGSPSNVYTIVNNGGSTDLPDLNGQAPTADGSVSAYQFDLGILAPGDERWVGVAFAHHGDPFASATAQGWLDAYVAGKNAKTLVDEEIASWASFQNALTVPAGMSADEETLLRQSAVMLSMAQVQEGSTFLRDLFTKDGEPRYSAPGEPKLPADVTHHGKGAVIASLPPGEWTIPWIRDGAYAATAMTTLGMKVEARSALLYYLNAQSGRFQSWMELSPYNMPPYQISLCRYYGFGVEETDFNQSGPNLEFDGIGLFLWALRHYDENSGDPTLVDSSWPQVSSKVADVLVALIDPQTGLMRPDSSIWETHWNGLQRSWAYTNLTAARGLCDAAALANRVGDKAASTKYQAAGVALGKAILAHLTDGNGALASNAEELALGEGYWDAAVIEGIAMGLFNPHGQTAAATIAGLDQNLAAPAGAGWSRNDDDKDHAGKADISPWGGPYDSAEWAVTDLRGAVAAQLMGDAKRADRLISWVKNQSIANYLAVSETYDEKTGQYKFNAPMVGFGAGVYALALAGRAKPLDGPACGAYIDGDAPATTTSSSSGSSSASSSSSGDGAGGATSLVGSSSSAGSSGSGGGGGGGADGGCGCRAAPTEESAWAWPAIAAMVTLIARRARRSTVARRLW